MGRLLLIAIAISFAPFIHTEWSDAQQASSLIGTIESGSFIGAVLSDAKGEQVVYRLRDKLPDGSQITAIRSDSISLKSADGTFYTMYISHDTKTVASSQPAAHAPVASPESAPRQLGPTPAQQEVINRIKQREFDRAQRRKNRGDE